MSAESMAMQIAINAKNNTEGAFGELDGRLGGLKTAALALGGALTGTLAGALGDAARAAAEEEVGIARLAGAIDNAGGSWAKQGEQIEAVIAQREQLSFSDGELRDSLSDLTIATGDVDEAMQRQTLAMDLARAKGISLKDASKLVGKVTDENVKVFARMGITVREGADASEVLATVQQKTAGASERYAGTTQGAIDRLKNTFDNWKESVGGMLGPLQGVFAALPGLQSGITLVGGAVGPLVGHLVQSRGALVAKLAALNPLTLATKAWALAQTALNLVLSANPIAIVVLALAGLAAGLKIAYDNSAEFRGIVQQLFAWLGNLLAPLGWVWARVMDLARSFGLVGGASETMKGEVGADFETMKTSAVASSAAMTTGVSAEVKKLEAYVPEAFRRMKDAGVGDAKAMEIDSILAAMGMSTGVRDAVSEMVAGVTGKTAEERDQIIHDMQTARLQAALRAAGMSEDVVAAIDGMVFSSKTKLEEMREAHGEKFRAMKERQAELRDSTLEAARGTDALRESIERLRDKTVTVTVNQVSRGGGGGDMIAAASGFDGMVHGPTMFLAGEAGSEHVQITPAAARSGGGGSGGGTHVTVNVAGSVLSERELLRTVQEGLMRDLRHTRHFM